MNFEILRKMQFELSGLPAYPEELQSSKEIKPSQNLKLSSAYSLWLIFPPNLSLPSDSYQKHKQFASLLSDKCHVTLGFFFFNTIIMFLLTQGQKDYATRLDKYAFVLQRIFKGKQKYWKFNFSLSGQRALPSL